MNHVKGKLVTLTLFLMVSTLIVTACGQPSSTSTDKSVAASTPGTSSAGTSSQGESASSSSSATAQPVQITLYFPTADASGLAVVHREVNVTNGALIKAAFQELQNPPSGLAKPLPEGTQLLNASVKNGVATLDLSPEFRKNFKGGSTGEQMTIFSIVDSLTSLPNVQSVQFLLNGQRQDAILGQLDTSQPLKFDKSLVKN